MAVTVCGVDIETATIANHHFGSHVGKCQRLNGEHILAEAYEFGRIVISLIVTILGREPVEIGIAVAAILSCHAEQAVARTDENAEVEA